MVDSQLRRRWNDIVCEYFEQKESGTVNCSALLHVFFAANLDYVKKLEVVGLTKLETCQRVREARS